MKTVYIFLLVIGLNAKAIAEVPGDVAKDVTEEVREESNKKEESPAQDKDEKSTMDKVIDTTLDVGEKVFNTGKKAVRKTNKKLGQSRLNRENKKHSITGNYTLLDTWIPGKYGVQYSYIESPSTSWEVSWDHGSLGYGFLFADIASIKDDRITVVRTSYSKRNSFYISYGLNYYKMSVTLGSKLMSSVSANNIPNAELVQISNFGGTFGIGNRWQFDTWTLGVNWVSVHLPLIVLKSETAYFDYSNNQSDRETVNDTMSVIERFPTLTALRIQVGVSF